MFLRGWRDRVSRMRRRARRIPVQSALARRLCVPRLRHRPSLGVANQATDLGEQLPPSCAPLQRVGARLASALLRRPGRAEGKEHRPRDRRVRAITVGIAALPEEVLPEPGPPEAHTPLLPAPRARTSLIVAGAVILIAILGDGWWTLHSTAMPSPITYSPRPFENGNFAAFSGRWVGIWDNNPLYTTSLIIESVSPTGDVTGWYVFYWSENYSKFAAKIADNTITFGRRYKFTFRLRPDSKMEGTRSSSVLLDRTVLTRDRSPVGQ